MGVGEVRSSGSTRRMLCGCHSRTSTGVCSICARREARAGASSLRQSAALRLASAYGGGAASALRALRARRARPRAHPHEAEVRVQLPVARERPLDVLLPGRADVGRAPLAAGGKLRVVAVEAVHVAAADEHLCGARRRHAAGGGRSGGRTSVSLKNARGGQRRNTGGAPSGRAFAPRQWQSFSSALYRRGMSLRVPLRIRSSACFAGWLSRSSAFSVEVVKPLSTSRMPRTRFPIILQADGASEE